MNVQLILSCTDIYIYIKPGGRVINRGRVHLKETVASKDLVKQNADSNIFKK